MENQLKNCQNCKKDFIIEPDNFGFYEKMGVPVPDTCPECRQQARMIFRNFKTLYKRLCSKSSKSIISMYNPEVPFPVYDIPLWWGDDWDPMKYAIDVDWDRKFSSQLFDLFNTVPHMSIMNRKSENCQYSNMVVDSANCYMIFGCVENEDCDYGHIVWNSKDSIDNLYIFRCEACHECIDCLNCNKLSYSEECESCADSIGLFDCKGCFNCVGCVGLINKSYCVFNKQVTKEEYAKFIKENPISNPEIVNKILLRRSELRKALPQRSFYGFRNNDVSGNHIYNAHNVHYSFDVKSGENSKFCYTVRSAIDSYDVGFAVDLSECYQSLTIAKSNKVIGSQTIIDSHDVSYSDNCYNCDNIFGCYGLRKKSYCILNKQYTKEEYVELLPKLIEHMKKHGEWGSFFPKELSPFAYNEAIVNEYMPLTKQEALAKGFRWKDNIPSTKGQGTLEYKDLPKNPGDYSDDLLSEVLTCDDCKKNYKLIGREINFYKKNKLALPNKCFNCRHEVRMSKRNPRNLWSADCAKCGAIMLTSYRPEDQKIYKIYCEKCYQQEMY